MWIVLNPQKAHRFTTQGINLYKGSPTAFIGPDTPGDVMVTINRAIAEGRVIRMQGNEMKGMVIPNQARISQVDDNDTSTVVRTQYIRDDNGKIISTVIVMPDKEGNAELVEVKPKSGAIITGITETPLDDEES